MRIQTRPLWQIRLARGLPRYLLYALCCAGLLESARFAVSPPRSPVPVPAREEASSDPAAAGYAVLFARRYLTWNAAEPQMNQRALEPFLGPTLESDAGLKLPSSGEQHVEWAEVVQEREPAAGEHVFTVAAQTDTAGLVYLSVSVARRAGGILALAGYPAFIGPPAAGPALLTRSLREVNDTALATVVERALRNYLAASAGELAADLTRGAQVSLPSLALTLQSVQRLDWSPDGRSVVAVVQAQDARGVQYSLAYEMDVALVEGRWEISAVQMDPDT